MASVAKVTSNGVANVAIKNTPQANADEFNLSENGSALVDPLANDLGGAAKTLWSIQQGNLAVQTADGESVLVDGGRLKVTVVGDQFLVVAGSGYDHLANGQACDTSFSYSIRMADGAIATSTVTITITGSNDAPVVSGTVTGTATEDAAASSLNALANATASNPGRLSASTTVGTSGASGDRCNDATASIRTRPPASIIRRPQPY